MTTNPVERIRVLEAELAALDERRARIEAEMQGCRSRARMEELREERSDTLVNIDAVRIEMEAYQ